MTTTMSNHKIFKSYSCSICNNAVFPSLNSLNKHKTWCYTNFKKRNHTKTKSIDANNSKLYKALNDFGVVNENESVDERDHNSSMLMDFNYNHDQECLSSIMIDTEKNNSLVENGFTM